MDVIIGNPPFLGDKKMRSEMGDKYVDDLRGLYEGRVPGGADLVTYWFERARAQLETAKAGRAGLLATNSIRGGANRAVLDRIKQSGDIFMAWSDRAWVLEGAAVRISIVGFDIGEETNKVLDGKELSHINPDLTSSTNITAAKQLKENKGIGFIGGMKKGKFDIPDYLAETMLSAINKSGNSNSQIVRRWINGLDITRSPRNMWIIDYGIDITETEAQLYEMPYEYVRNYVKPERDKVNNPNEKSKWWLHARPAPDLRAATADLDRYMVTPRVAKHRLFVWIDTSIIIDGQLVAVARSDDYFFGVLHSYLHEIWSLRLGTSLEDRSRYTPTTTFETFPFPWPPGKEDTASPHYAAISAAAKQLHEEREAWRNPPDLIALGADSKALKERTLTNLYNAVVAHRAGKPNGEKLVKPARDFAPRLAELHDALDRAVLAAYGWEDLLGKLRTPEGDEELLRRLLALNLARAGAQ